MKINKFKAAILVGMLAVSSVMSVANAGYIVVNNDEWTLSERDNQGEFRTDTTSQFIDNITSLFAGGDTGNFLAYSSNFGVTGTLLGDTVEDAGNNWTVDNSLTFDLATLSNYDGLFLAGTNSNLDQDIILEYVEQGGNVYIAAGTGGGAANEASDWNTVLEAIGLQYTSSYNLIRDTFDTVLSDDLQFDDLLLEDVSSLYFNNGNTIVDLNLANTNGEIILSSGQSGLLAVGTYGITDVPEPGTLSVFALGLLGFAGYRRRQNR